MKKNLFLSAVALLVCGTMAFSQDHHWPLTSDLNDAVGSLNGTDHGVTFQNDNVRGPVAYFDGSGYANLPGFINGLTEITISCWFRMDEAQVWSRIYSFGHGDQTEPKDVLMVIPVGGNNNMYRFTLSNPDGAWYDIDMPAEVISLELNTWYFSAVVLKPDSIIFYHNDVKVFAESGFTRAFGTITDTENAIGKSFWADPMWKGAMSDLRVYNSALSESAVIDLYNSTIPVVGVGKVENGVAAQVYSYDNKIRIKLDEANNDEIVSVYSLTGALLASKPVSEIEALNFNTGVYIVKINGAEVNYATKVLVR